MTSTTPHRSKGEPWYWGTGNEVLDRLGARANGLTSSAARKFLAEHGPNTLKEAKPISPWAIFFAQFNSIVIWILIGAGIVSGLLGEAIDAFAILAIVVLNAVVGFHQEFSAEKSVAALKQMTAPQAKVWRDGAVSLVAAREIVVGDILELESGDVVAADARLLIASSLSCVEAALTGKSDPVDKIAEALNQDNLPLADRENMIFMGTSVATGSGRAVVVATGMQTEIGGIAALIAEADEDKGTPLQQKFESFGRVLLWATLAIIILLFGLGLVRGTKPFDLFLTSVSLAVAALPEGLPAVVTAALSIGVLRMSRRRALVRRLASVETLGSTSVICTDKTGTLTVGQMTVRALFIAGHSYEVTGEGYGPEGETRFEGKMTDERHASPLRQMAEVLIGCNNAHLEWDNGAWRVIGDPTEGALLAAGHKAGVRRDELERDMPKHHEIPFDSERKRHSVVRVLPDGRQRAFINGAPELLLARCAYILSDDGVRPMTEADRDEVAEKNAELAGKALRVLGSAFRDFDPQPTHILTAETVERDLVFVGLAGLYDPPRPEAKDAVARCRAAGIRVVMITGDHPRTALAIARELGIDSGGEALTGTDLDGLTDANLRDLASGISVYARVSAVHKLRIVRAWQANNAVVAMTGDGVNDAPAIKGADVGIAMGLSGTEVSKQASDIIITDDNFATIVAAVEEGRGVYENIRKTIHYLLSGNSGELLLMTICVVIGLPAPLLPIHLLWINLVTDGPPALCLAADRIDPAVMKQRPRPREENIVDRRFLGMMVLTGVLTAGVSFGSYAYGLRFETVDTARTYAFAALVFAELLRAFGARSDTRSIWRMNIGSNLTLLAVVGLSISIQVWSQHNDLLAAFFKTTRVPFRDCLIILAVSATPLIILEILKLVSGRTAGGQQEMPPIEGDAKTSQIPTAPALQNAGTRGAGWRTAVVTFVVIMLAFGGGWILSSLYRDTPIQYRTQTLERGALVRSVKASGVLVAAATVPVSARRTGTIQSLSCDVNMQVKAGQLCGKLDPRTLQEAVDRAKAELSAAKATLANDTTALTAAKAAVARDEKLPKRRARKALAQSREALTRAQSQVKRDEAALAARQAALRAAEIALGSTDLVSPIEGSIVSRSVEVGQKVTPSDRLFLVADLSALRLMAKVDEIDIGAIKPGQTVRLTVEGFVDRDFAGEVAQIDPAPPTSEPAADYNVAIHAPNPDLLLKPGMTARIEIELARREDVVHVPHQALRYALLSAAESGAGAPREGWSPLLILRAGKPMAILVKPGLDDGTSTEIIAGDLRPGDELILGESKDVPGEQQP